MTSAAWDIQKAIYAALASAVAPVVVYDNVPQNAAFPYVTIGEDTAIQWDTMPDGSGKGHGQEATLTIHTWSRYAGRKETKELQGSIYTALHNQSLSMDDHTMALLQFEYADSFMDDDGRTRHGVQRFRMLVTAD